jgi:hypothetical protein
VESEKQLIAEAGREKMRKRREDRTNKQNDNKNTTEKAKEQREAEVENRGRIHKKVAGSRRQ